MRLPDDRLSGAPAVPGVEMRAEPGIAKPVGTSGPVLLPQQRPREVDPNRAFPKPKGPGNRPFTQSLGIFRSQPAPYAAHRQSLNWHGGSWLFTSHHLRRLIAGQTCPGSRRVTAHLRVERVPIMPWNRCPPSRGTRIPSGRPECIAFDRFFIRLRRGSFNIPHR